MLNPKNEEAIYLLADLNIKKSDFSKAKELIDTLEVVCEKLCPSKKGLLEKLESLSKDLVSILSFVEELKKLDTKKTEPLSLFALDVPLFVGF